MSGPLTLQACTVDLRHNRLHRAGRVDVLTTMERDLLAYLVAHGGRAVPREELLREVWGYGPGVASRAVDSTVKRLRPKIESDPAQPVHLLTVHGIGYRFEIAAEVQQRSADGSTNVVAPGDRFVGRAPQCATLDTWIEEGQRAITLLGPGGVGKTRIATEWALSRAPSGWTTWFVDLAPTRDADGVTEAIAAALQARPEGNEGLVAAIGRILGTEDRICLILDNAEQVVDAVASLVTDLIGNDPTLVVLITTRQRLGLRAEATLEIGPLPQADAVALFLERARTAGASLSRADSGVEEVVRGLDGLPLAIELAAARSRVLPPVALLPRLDRSLDLLRGESWLPPRHQTLRDTFAWSWDLLTSAEQVALGQCTVFRGGFTLDAAEGVLDLGAHGPPVLDVLQALVSKSMVKTAEGRFDLLQVVRALAAEDGPAPEVSDRHAAYFAASFDALRDTFDWDWGGRDLARIAAEADNHRAVVDRMRIRAPDLAARCALSLHTLSVRRGLPHVRIDLAETAAVLAQDPAVRIHALLARSAQRPEDLDVALALARDEGLVVLEIAVLRKQGRSSSDPAASAVRFEAAIALAQSLCAADPAAEGLVARMHYELGRLASIHGDDARAVTEYRGALDLSLRCQLPIIEAQSRFGLGFFDLDRGRCDAAEAHFRAAMAAYDREDDDRAEVLRAVIGLVDLDRGDLASAEDILRRSLDWGRSFVNVAPMAEDHFVLGLVLLMGDRRGEAAEVLQVAARGFGGLGRGADVRITNGFLAVALAPTAPPRARALVAGPGTSPEIALCKAIVDVDTGGDRAAARRVLDDTRPFAQRDCRTRQAHRLLQRTLGGDTGA